MGSEDRAARGRSPDTVSENGRLARGSCKSPKKCHSGRLLAGIQILTIWKDWIPDRNLRG
jgi:hypothetical protein